MNRRRFLKTPSGSIPLMLGYDATASSNLYFGLAEIHTYIHTFNGPFCGSTRVSRYQKGKPNLDFTEATDSERQWHQLGDMQLCTSLQTDNHASTPPLSFFTGRMPFLLPNQQCQSTEGRNISCKFGNLFDCHISPNCRYFGTVGGQTMWRGSLSCNSCCGTNAHQTIINGATGEWRQTRRRV